MKNFKLTKDWENNRVIWRPMIQRKIIFLPFWFKMTDVVFYRKFEAVRFIDDYADSLNIEEYIIENGI